MYASLTASAGPGSKRVRKSELIGSLPPEWSESLLPSIRSRLLSSSPSPASEADDGGGGTGANTNRPTKKNRKPTKLVVLDDDPTGTQTVHDVPVLTVWGVDDIAAEFADPTVRAFYILTNSRSVTPPAAQDLTKEIARNLLEAAKQTDTTFEVVSRSDSTLRGHYPGEVDALIAALRLPDAVTLLVPFFYEGGRITVHDVHYCCKTAVGGDYDIGVLGGAWAGKKSLAAEGPNHTFDHRYLNDCTVGFGEYAQRGRDGKLRHRQQYSSHNDNGDGDGDGDGDGHDDNGEGGTEHYDEQEFLVPAAETSFAQDSAFGYTKSNLRDWVVQMTGGRIPRDRTFSVSIDDLRKGGPGRVSEVLKGLPPRSVCVVNSVSLRDQEVFVDGLLRAEEEMAAAEEEEMSNRANGGVGGSPSVGDGSSSAGGDRRPSFVYRTAATFVRVRLGIGTKPLLMPEEMGLSPTIEDGAAGGGGGRSGGGLTVVGSYVPITTRQLDVLLDRCKDGTLDAVVVEVSVSALLSDELRQEEIDRVVHAANDALARNRDAILYTSRVHVTVKNRAARRLEIGARVSDGLAAVVRGISCRPRYVLAKGGITASDTATQGLGVKRATVIGEVSPGVIVWKLGDETRYPGMPYIVFPGDVGYNDGVAELVQKLQVPRS